MGVYIKGMEMPKAGYIDVRIFPDGIASKAIGEKPYYKEFHVVEVKDPHGRLIDADALMAVSAKRLGVINADHIAKAKTVLEAEGKDDG